MSGGLPRPQGHSLGSCGEDMAMVLAIGGHVSLGDIKGPAHAVMVGGRCGGSHDRHDSTFLCVHSAKAFDRSRSPDRASMPTMSRRHGIGAYMMAVMGHGEGSTDRG